MKKILFIIVMTTGWLSTYAQVGIGTPTPDSSAMLDVSSANKGVLIPNVDLKGSTDATTIPGSKTSLLVYNTGSTTSDIVSGFYYWDGSKWKPLGGGGGDSANKSTFIEKAAQGNVPAVPADNDRIPTTLAVKDYVNKQAIDGISITTIDSNGVVTTTPATSLSDVLNAKEDKSNKVTYVDDPAIPATATTPAIPAKPANDIKFPTTLAVQKYVSKYIDSKVPIVKNVSADYTVKFDGTDSNILCNVTAKSITITMPTATVKDKDKTFVIRKGDTSDNKILFSPNLKFSAETVASLNYAKSFKVQCDGIDWRIIEFY